jgi:hypothetical protein
VEGLISTSLLWNAVFFKSWSHKTFFAPTYFKIDANQENIKLLYHLWWIWIRGNVN